MILKRGERKTEVLTLVRVVAELSDSAAAAASAVQWFSTAETERRRRRRRD